MFRTVSKRASCVLAAPRRGIRTTNALSLFYEPDPKSGYVDRTKKVLTEMEHVRQGFWQLKDEFKLLYAECREGLHFDPIQTNRAGETDVLWRFDRPEALEKWVVTSDSDYNEGFSKCSLTINKLGKGLFAGVLDKRPPKDGKTKRAGYCNMATLPARKSFQRKKYLDWMNYNCVVMKVRGDGRSYMLNIHCQGFLDIMWNDVYHCPLHTRGGPYWQLTRVPFSKFVFSSKGRVQDKQHHAIFSRITNFSVTAAKLPGSFGLEIDYIGLEYDPMMTELTAYEMYDAPGGIAGF